MKILPFSTETLRVAVDILKRGGVVAHPADTCFGLAGDLMNPKALEKIQAIKGREEKKPMSVMISVPEQIRIREYALLDDFSSFVAFKLFPSPVTLLLPRGPKIPDYYFPESPKIGLRVPMHDLTQDLLIAFGGPLITTSANRSGKAALYTHDEVEKAFAGQDTKPDLIIAGRIKIRGLSSTVIGVEDDHLRIIREGPVTAKQLQSILGVKVKE